MYGMNSRMRAASGWSPATEFDDFLGASIGEERNGRLSVISMLGRLGIDPRTEAFQLANLPRSAAARRLATLIERMPDRTASATDAKIVAECLVARLPRRPAAPEAPAGAAANLRITSSWTVILMTALAIWISVELFFPSQTSPASGPTATEADRP